MIKSEFNPYLNMTYVILNKKGDAFCYEKYRYLKQRTFNEVIDDIEDLAEKTEQVATDSIEAGNIDTLAVANALDNSVNGIIANMELYLLQYKWN